MNPVTRLWEFYHLRSAWDHASGDPATSRSPATSPTAASRLGPDSGIVFVLLPGEGETRTVLPRAARADPGQWSRLHARRGAAPSRHRGATRPVEQVSWTSCRSSLGRHGLQLPSAPEWTYACRAGTTTAWFPGPTPAHLRGHANVLDAKARASRPDWPGDPAPFDDGHTLHAPVGSYAPNAFGLYDMHGNVAEWCADAASAAADRFHRGGSFRSNPARTRADARGNDLPTRRSDAIGVRPARLIL